MHAPQIIWLCWMCLGLGHTVANNGKQITGTYSITSSLIRSALLLTLLWWGGFFGQAQAAELPAAAFQHRATLIREARAQWGMNPPSASFAAQLHQESRWRADAVSAVGAKGMGQFMPATAKWMPSVDPSLATSGTDWGVTNPAWDIRALVTYDRWLYQRVSAADVCQRMAKTYRGYNGGLVWIQRDEQKARALGVNSAVNFGALDQVNAGRSAAAFRENVQYPRLILLKFEPLYVKAGFGAGACT